MLNKEQQIFELIKKSRNILIVFANPNNGDSVASALALFLLLKKINKKADIVANYNGSKNENLENKLHDTRIFSFLPGFPQIKNSLDNLRKFIISLDIRDIKVDQIKYKLEEDTLDFIVAPKDGFFTSDHIQTRSSNFKYDLIISIDTQDLESLGKLYDNDTEFFYQTTIVNIDHQAQNEEFGQVNLIDLNAVSVSEILFSLFENYRELMDEDIATCLLAGIIYKTKSFKTPNITPHALSVTSQLVSMGARREEIVNRLYRSHDLGILKLWGRVLARLSSGPSNELVWSSLLYSDFTKTQSDENNILNVIDELIINIPQAKIIIVFYESLDEKNSEQEVAITKAIIYSVKNINSLDLVREFHPEGTSKIARIQVAKALQVASREIINLVGERMGRF